MKKTLLLIILSFFTLKNVAQKSDNFIIYKKFFAKRIFKSDKKNKSHNFNKFKVIEEKAIDILKTIEFQLVFNINESFFDVVSSLELADNKFAGFALGPEGSASYYNSSTIRMSKVNIFGEDFLVTDRQLKWQLKNETKKIGDYLCYKAVAIEKELYRGKMKDYPIIAWYCPEINASFGPIGIAGLPGLILEVNKGSIRYAASKINLNSKKNFIIKKLTKGKRVTREKLGEMIDEAMGNFKKNRGY